MQEEIQDGRADREVRQIQDVQVQDVRHRERCSRPVEKGKMIKTFEMMEMLERFEMVEMLEIL
jgi:hypothetical protein